MSGFGAFVGGLFEGAKSTADLMEQRNRMYWQYLDIKNQQDAKAAADKKTAEEAAARAAGTSATPVAGPTTTGAVEPPPEAKPQLRPDQTPTTSGGSPSLVDRVRGWVSWRESNDRPNVGFEGSGTPEEKATADLTKYGPREGYFGFPNWPGNIDPATGNRAWAAGLFGFTPETWKRYAGPLGITDFSPESQIKVFNAAYLAEGIRPWQGNRELIADLGAANLLGGAATDPARAASPIAQKPAPTGPSPGWASSSATAGDPAKPAPAPPEDPNAAKAKAATAALLKTGATAVASAAPARQSEQEPPLSALNIPSAAPFTPATFARAATSDQIGSSMVGGSSALAGSSYTPQPVTPYSPAVRPVLAGLRQEPAMPAMQQQQAAARPQQSKVFRMPNGTLVDGIGNIIRPGPSSLYPRDRENA
jgi:hypothetical protein